METARMGPTASLDRRIPPWPLPRRPRAPWVSQTGAWRPLGSLSSGFLNVLLFLCLLLIDMAQGSSAHLKEDSLCISKEAMDVSEPIKRHVIDIKLQQTMPLTIADTDRVSHRLTNAIFKKFLQGVVGYQEVEMIYFEDTMTPLHSPYYLESHEEEKPAYMVNLEVWFQPGYSDHGNSKIKDLGSQGTGGRYGWFVYNTKNFDSTLIFDHWRSYQNENITGHFALTAEQQQQVETIFTRDEDGLSYCPESKCPNGIFVPEICNNRQCATLFAGAFKYSSFLIKQVTSQRLLVQVAWIGPNLTPHFIERFRGESPVLFFSWWPSPTSILPNLLRIAFPSCTEVMKYDGSNFLCKYEMHTLRKQSWDKLENFGKFAYDTVERFHLQEDDYRDILRQYNERTAPNYTDTHLQAPRGIGWDDDIVDAIACDWLKSTGKGKDWRPHRFNDKPEMWFAGIFPFTTTSGKYSSRTLAFAAEMAITDVNMNRTILSDYNLSLKYSDGGCSSDEVLYAFIRYIRATSLELNKLIGILGPSCSDTVEPLAGIARLFNTVIISYSAEGAIFNDQGNYPSFFRTIPENILYGHVYLNLIKTLNWKRLASLTKDGTQYSEYLTYLEYELRKENISISNRKLPREARKVIPVYLKQMQANNFRVIIGDFYSGVTCEIMCEAYLLKMTARYGYTWFLPSWFTHKWFMNCTKLGVDITCTAKQMLEALDGHFSLGYAYYASDDFTYHSGETVREWKERYGRRFDGQSPADYAGYTYDAVWTYAFALHKLIQESFTHAANMRSNLTNNRFVELLRQTDFQGVSGRINFPQGTSRQSNVDIKQFRASQDFIDGYYHTVGTFIPSNSMKGKGGDIHLNRTAIKWLTEDGKQPGDGSLVPAVCALEPFSRFLGVSCEFTIVITMIICFVIFASVVIGCFCCYKIKYEKPSPPPWHLQNLLNLDEWEIPRDHVIINRTIGAGAFGTVYGGECKLNEDSGWAAVAVKTLKKGSTAEDKLEFLGEAEMMKRFDQRNIVKLIGLSTRQEPIFMIMEFMLYGDLRTYLLARRHLVFGRPLYCEDDEISDRRLTSMAHDVTCALEYLAANKYIHRDVACRNCLVNADRVIKLSDFGMTRPVYESNYYKFNRKGMLPVRWMAPESIENGIYTTKSDVWSFGVLLYEIITFGNLPFQGMSNSEVLEQVIKHNKTLVIPDRVRPQLKQIMRRCWDRDPAKRPDFTELSQILSNYTHLITPCLVPLAPVQTNNSDSVELGGIDPTCLAPVNTTFRQPQHQNPSQQPLHSDHSSTNVLGSGPTCSGVCSNGPQFFHSHQQPPVNGEEPGSRSRWNRTPMENGNGPAMEPLLPITGVDSYITRYASLQMNKKSPDGEQESPGVGMTAV